MMFTTTMHTTLLLCTILGIMSMSAGFHDFKVQDIQGNTKQLADYKGKVVLIVNVASFCGYTRQYEPLEKLYRTYKDKGLVVLGFPSNDFGAQEPGTNAEIQNFCKASYDVTFDMFGKVTVKGAGKVPLFEWLTSGGGNAALAGEIGWNFEKFLIGKDGKLIKRYATKEEPMSASMTADIEAALAD
jgi:glutathione peroxidase